MHTTAEIRVESLSGDTMRSVVDSALAVLEEAKLRFETHEHGTNVSGPMADVLGVVEKIHERLHAEGVKRLSTHLTLGTRTDGASILEDLDVSKLPDTEQPPRLA